VRLGNSGLKVSVLCLGCMSYGDKKWREWVLEKQKAIPEIKRALQLGINFFDTADVYSTGVSEEILGAALKDVPRESVVVATKVHGIMGPGPNQRGLSRKHIFESVDASLKILQMEYIDLYQIHRWDYTTPIEETMDALNDLVRSGKVRYIGASSMSAWQFAKAQFIAEKNGWTKFISMQNHYNLVYREEEREMIPLCIDMGVGCIPWSPIARGFLTGSRKRDGKKETTRSNSDPFADTLYFQSSDFDVVDRVTALAAKRGVTPAQIAIAWLLHKPGVVSPIIGATKREHLEEAVAAININLSGDEIKYLEEPYKPHDVLGITTPPRPNYRVMI